MSETESAAAICPSCGGRGWVVEADGGAGKARPCDCRRRVAAPRLLAAAGIPPLYQRCTLDSFNTQASTPAEQDQLVRALSVCRRYVDDFVDEDGNFRDTGLLFVGAPGVGKTHLAVAVLAELVRRYGVHGRFVDFTTLVHRIQSTFDPSSEDSKHEILDPVATCEVLVLDELGAQQPTEWVQNTLYLILNTRYTRRLPTIFTTNYRLEVDRKSVAGQAGHQWEHEQRRQGEERVRRSRPDLLEHRVSPGLLSRLYEMARIVSIDSEDFRREVKMQRLAL